MIRILCDGCEDPIDVPTGDLDAEIARLTAERDAMLALARWCRPRMKRDCYRDRIDAVLANPALMDPDPEMTGKLVQSSDQQQERTEKP